MSLLSSAEQVNLAVGFEFFVPLTHDLSIAYREGLRVELFNSDEDTPQDWSRNLDWIRRVWDLARDYEAAASEELSASLQIAVDAIGSNLDNADRALGLTDSAEDRMKLAGEWIRRAEKGLAAIRANLGCDNGSQSVGLLEARKRIPKGIEALQNSVERNFNFLAGRVKHALETPSQINQNFVQNLVCMDLRLLFFLTLIDRSLSGGLRGKFTICLEQHKEAFDTIKDPELKKSIKKRRDLCLQLKDGSEIRHKASGNEVK